MNWTEVLDEIESPAFDFELHMASSTSQFFRLLSRHPIVSEAHVYISQYSDWWEDALGRIFDLSSEEIDERFRNPHDSALATLLWLVSLTTPDATRTALSYIDQAPNCWYARQLANFIRQKPTELTASVFIPLTESPRPSSFSKSVSIKAAITGPPIRYYSAVEQGLYTTLSFSQDRKQQ